jgi:hypothetical protein
MAPTGAIALTRRVTHMCDPNFDSGAEAAMPKRRRPCGPHRELRPEHARPLDPTNLQGCVSSGAGSLSAAPPTVA